MVAIRKDLNKTLEPRWPLKNAMRSAGQCVDGGLFPNARMVAVRKDQSKNPQIRMGAMKNYLLTLLQHCSEETFGQDAVEYAIVSGAVTLTYHLETDLRAIMGEP